MPVKSLYALAKARAIACIDSIDDVGDLPYSFVEPIIRHIRSPDQLKELEQNSPQLQGKTGELWLRFVKRDIPGWEHNKHEPKDPKNWPKAYAMLKRSAEKIKAAQEEKLKEEMKKLTAEKNKSTVIIEPGSRLARMVPKPKRSRFSGGGISAPGPRSTGHEALDKFKKGLINDKNASMARNPRPLLATQELGKVQKAPERLLRLNEAAKIDKAVLDRAAGRAPAASTATTTPAHHDGAPPDRPRLPEGQRFTAPKLKMKAARSVPSTATPPAAVVSHSNVNTPQASAAVQKRKREEPNIFMQTKRRKV